MGRISKIIFFAVILNGIMLITFADRGINKKAKSKVSLNIASNSTFANNLSFNLKTGLKYKGSLISNDDIPSSSIYNTLITYQKGNTIYILPYKQKVIVPEIHQGYTGMKLIIKAK
ncbi:MAG TPA: hypothetical protein VK498_04075 [Ferruginibacter sp.]|nr:hypothetical protein [Ferruginibacter sp.]